MSTFIGNVKGPRHNSPSEAFEVWCSLNTVEIHVVGTGSTRNLDPVAARNLAALLVRASEEAERMTARKAPEDNPIDAITGRTDISR